MKKKNRVIDLRTERSFRDFEKDYLDGSFLSELEVLSPHQEEEKIIRTKNGKTPKRPQELKPIQASPSPKARKKAKILHFPI